MYESFQYMMVAGIAISLVCLIAKAWKHPRRPLLITRMWNDVYLAWKNTWIILLAAFGMYVQGVIGRSLAFYLHRQMADYVVDPAKNLKQTRLNDLGHQLLPDTSGNEAITIINEALQYSMFGFLAAVFAYPYWTQLISNRCVGTYSVNMVTRFLVCFSTGHLLRMLCYVGTSLPGPSEHCIGDIERENRPTKLSSIFWQPKVGANCGDLVFSGHMLTATTILCTIQYYTAKMRGFRSSIVLVALISPLYIWQIINILLARAHYTVDLVVAIEMTIFYFTSLCRVWWPNDYQPRWDPSISTAGFFPVGNVDTVIESKENCDPNATSSTNAVTYVSEAERINISEEPVRET